MCVFFFLFQPYAEALGADWGRRFL